MSKPDIILNEYWSSNEEFADLFNSALFKKDLIPPEKLAEMDTNMSATLPLSEITSFPSGRGKPEKTTQHGRAEDTEGILKNNQSVKTKYIKTIQANRDILKIFKMTEDKCLILLGIENQMEMHYAMPLRVMQYDSLAYRQQYYQLRSIHAGQKDLATNAEFLSGMKKTDKLLPVVTLVIYYGDEPWDGPLSLHDMMNLSQDMKPFINDYKVNLLQIRDSDITFHNRNNQDFFHMLRISYDNSMTTKEKEEAILHYVADREETDAVDEKVIQALAASSGLSVPLSEKGGYKMSCKFFNELREEGKMDGLREGEIRGRIREIIELGLEESWSDQQIIHRLLYRLGSTEEEARNYLDQYRLAIK